jgi:catalase
MTVIVGPRKGTIKSGTTGTPDLDVKFSFETCRFTFFDAIFFAGGTGDEYLADLTKNGRLIHVARTHISRRSARQGLQYLGWRMLQCCLVL